VTTSHPEDAVQRQIELAYVGIEVPDPASLSPFLGDLIGLQPGAADGATVTWRNDDRAQRIIVQPGPADDAVFIGFEAIDDAAFDATTASLIAAGFDVTAGSAAECRQRHVDRLVRTTAPFGVDVEVVERLAPAATPFSSPVVPGGFLTEGVGFGHVVFATTAFDESCRFLTAGLGLVRSDWLEMEVVEGIELVVHFFHCNERHHTVALAKAPFDLPQRLHHVMVEARDRDDVGAAFDRVWRSDLAIPNGLGRHDNDGMFSFYVRSPAGFQVEVGHGARLITEPWDDDRRYERISMWGHQPLRPT
jgi:2,3-dihydroxybiphenyl 1,2-dioxygenase